MLLVRSQLFVLFDLKKNNVVEFSEFVRALSVFHPKAPLEEKAECEPSLLIDPLVTQQSHVNHSAGSLQTRPCQDSKRCLDDASTSRCMLAAGNACWGVCRYMSP